MLSNPETKGLWVFLLGDRMKKPLLGAMVCVLGMCSFQLTHAFKDPLDLPALKAPRAAKALALNVVSQGSNVLVVGERGIVLKRDFAAADAIQRGVKDRDGRVWQQTSVPVSVNLTGAAFASDRIVFVVGHDGVILKSSDGGDSWVKVFDGVKANQQVLIAGKREMDFSQAKFDAFQDSLPASMSKAQEAELKELEIELETAQFAFEDAEAGARFGPARPMLDVWFKDENTGWVVGSYGQIFETRNGGNDWVLIAERLDNPDSRHYNGLSGDSSGLLLIAGEAGRIYRSTDFGQNWERLDTGYAGHFYGTAVMKNADGGSSIFAYGFGGNVYRLRAGESTWTKLDSPSKESFVQGLNVENRVLFVDQKGRLVSTDEAGSVLTMVVSTEGSPVTGMAQVGQALVFSGQNGPRTIALPK